jgi:archaellum component FlaC
MPPPQPANQEAPPPASPPRPPAEVLPPVAAAELAPTHAHALDVLQQGEIPMTRTWKMFGLQTVLAAALTAAPALATGGPEDDDKKNKKTDSQRLDNIENALTEIQKSIEALAKGGTLKVEALKGRIKKLEEQLTDLQSTLDEVRKKLNKKETTSGYPPEDMDDIKNRLTAIEKKLDKMTNSARIAKAPPEVGKIIITNRYSDEVLVMINKESYRVPAGQTITVMDVPAGTFTYEVIADGFGSVKRKTTTLAANRTFRINVD